MTNPAYYPQMPPPRAEHSEPSNEGDCSLNESRATNTSAEPNETTESGSQHSGPTTNDGPLASNPQAAPSLHLTDDSADHGSTSCTSGIAKAFKRLSNVILRRWIAEPAIDQPWHGIVSVVVEGGRVEVNRDRDQGYGNVVHIESVARGG